LYFCHTLSCGSECEFTAAGSEWEFTVAGRKWEFTGRKWAFTGSEWHSPVAFTRYRLTRELHSHHSSLAVKVAMLEMSNGAKEFIQRAAKHYRSGQKVHYDLLGAAVATLGRGFLGTSASAQSALIWQVEARVYCV
jgi:hypothetical protein